MRAATRIGVGDGGDAAGRAERIEALLDVLGLARDPSPTRSSRSSAHLATDKKHAAGRLRWVLPTADGVTVRDDVDPALVEHAASSLLAAGSPR